jgi:hypothetical protein
LACWLSQQLLSLLTRQFIAVAWSVMGGRIRPIYRKVEASLAVLSTLLALWNALPFNLFLDHGNYCGSIDLQRFCQAEDYPNGRLVDAPLYEAHKITLHLSFKTKLFLCQTRFLAKAT